MFPDVLLGLSWLTVLNWCTVYLSNILDYRWIIYHLFVALVTSTSSELPDVDVNSSLLREPVVVVWTPRFGKFLETLEHQELHRLVLQKRRDHLVRSL